MSKKSKPKAKASDAVTPVSFEQNVALDSLKPDPANPRTWSAEALSGLASCIRTFGLVEPLVRSSRTGLLIGGHMRLAAMRKAGLTHAPLVATIDIAKGDARVLGASLNNRALMGRFVPKKTKALLAELEKTHAELYVQLGLGTILEQAEQDEAGAGGKKRMVEHTEGVRAIKHTVTESLYKVYLRCMARAKEMCVDDGLQPEHADANVALEKILAEFITTHGEPKDVKDQPAKVGKSEK